MARCEHCGFGHALPDRCVNCGSTDPFPRRRIIKLASLVVLLAASVAFGFYFYERTQYFRKAEEQAKAVGERVFDVRPGSPAPPNEGTPAAAE